MDFDLAGNLRTNHNLHKDVLSCQVSCLDVWMDGWMDGWRYRAYFQLQQISMEDLRSQRVKPLRFFFADTSPLYLCFLLCILFTGAQAPWGPYMSFNSAETQRKYLKVCMGITVKIAYLTQTDRI